MIRKSCLFIALAGTLGGTMASDSERALASTNNAANKAKEVTLCLSGSRTFLVNPLPELPVPGSAIADSFVANFISEVFDCADVEPGTGAQNDAPKAGVSKLGDAAWTCSWVQPADPTKNLKRASCTGLLTLASGWHKTTPLSTAAISFWADTSEILQSRISGPIAPAVTATTGAWPKPETVTGFNWAVTGGKLQLTIKYKTRGWKPTTK